MFATPILFIIFIRPLATQRVFEQIKRIKPTYLFIAADGPRTDKPEDKERCEVTRKIIDQIDWKCDLKTLLRAENRGCGFGPSEAISWFFDHVKQGIILEDDCVPNLDFFHFCERLLDKYEHNIDIFQISGTLPLVSWKSYTQDYLISKFGGTWGWATWRRAWNKFDYKASAWKELQGKRKVQTFLENDTFYSHFLHEFNISFSEIRNDIWDYQWLFCRFYWGGYSIMPTVNLVTNVGFSEDATHTFHSASSMANLPTNELLNNNLINIHGNDKLLDYILFEKTMSTTKKHLLKRLFIKLAIIRYNTI